MRRKRKRRARARIRIVRKYRKSIFCNHFEIENILLLTCIKFSLQVPLEEGKLEVVVLVVVVIVVVVVVVEGSTSCSSGTIA
jgi:hypothetical protein